MTDRREDEVAKLVAELQETLRELQDELAGPERSRRDRGPAGLPRPPSPRELLSFATDYAIPTTIAFLEANVRALETLQYVLRVADRNPAEEGGRGLDERASRIGRDTVAGLNEALATVERELADGTLPRSDEARDIVDDARRLNRDIGDWIRDAETAADDSRTRIEADEAAERGEATDVPIEIDVDSELDSIREEIRGDTDARNGAGAGDGTAGDDETDDEGDEGAAEDGDDGRTDENGTT